MIAPGSPTVNRRRTARDSSDRYSLLEISAISITMPAARSTTSHVAAITANNIAVRFGLYAAEELTAADGSKIPADGLLAVTGIDADGIGCFAADLPYGRYIVREIAAVTSDGSESRQVMNANRRDTIMAARAIFKALLFLAGRSVTRPDKLIQR